MNNTSRSRVNRSPQVMVVAAALFVAILGSIGGCQGRQAPRSKPAQILFDSLLAGNEAQYDSATANLGWDRLTCLDARGLRQLGGDELRGLALEAERTVRAKHTRAEYQAGERGISMLHDAPSDEFCRQVDSLWYATMVKKPQRRP